MKQHEQIVRSAARRLVSPAAKTAKKLVSPATCPTVKLGGKPVSRSRWGLDSGFRRKDKAMTVPYQGLWLSDGRNKKIQLNPTIMPI